MKAPQVTSLRLIKLSANQVHVKWDPVGSNFFYFTEIVETRNASGDKIPEADLRWISLGYSPSSDKFISSGVKNNSYYKIRVSVTANGFDMSDWVYTEEFLTFDKNIYTFEHMREFSLSEAFINEKFLNNNQTYVDFNNDQILASLMSESFQFTSKYSDISQVSDKVLKENMYHEIQGTPDGMTRVCNDINRVMLGEIDGILYLFERYQNVVKVSNDKGQTWKYYKAFDDRVGNPVSKTCIYQNATTSFVLGYDRVFYGRRSSDIRWSDDQVRFSNIEITFAKIGDTLDLGFDVETFSTYAHLPGNITRYGEAIAASDDYLWVAGRNNLRFVDLKDAPIDTDPNSPSYGRRLFDDKNIKITSNDKVVVKKMDVIDGKLFVLITGEVKEKFMDPTNPKNVIDSKDKGVYMLNGDKFIKVFGLNDEELRKIEHEYTNMSTNGDEIFISYANYRYPGVQPDEINNPNVGDAVKYIFETGGLSDKHYHMGSIRAHKSDLTKWEIGFMEYYAEPWFTWMARSKTRCWITNDDRPMVVYPSTSYTKIIDEAGPISEDRVLKEVWNKGKGTFYSKNINFSGFKQYAGGVLIHKNTGELIGYYEFHYRVRDEANIIWLPKLTMFTADLQNQEHEIPWTPDNGKFEKDPDLRPLLTTMVPDSYLLQDSNFEKFAEYYLQYLSDGNGTYYNKLLNLIRNKYPRERNAYEYIWSEINKRNIYLDKKKRDDVVRFFEARKSDFYSTKGTEASYKFLFKLLYNEDVEIEMESKAGLEYDIVVHSDNISQDVVGRTIYTPTGRCNVTYIEKEYKDGKLQWRITIHNMIGQFMVGQVIKAERNEFEGDILVGIRGKDVFTNNIDYMDRSRSYYTMKIKSRLPTSRYSNDVIRFVHPVGFGFIGITLLTMFINSGLSLKHTETIIERMLTYRFDSGYPSEWIDRVAVFDFKGDREFDRITGEALYVAHPNVGQPFDIPSTYDSDEGYVPPADGDTSYTNMEEYLQRVPPSQRRKRFSPLFDQSATTFSVFRKLTSLLVAQDEAYRLKDNIGNPRDPEHPTQVKVE